MWFRIVFAVVVYLDTGRPNRYKTTTFSAPPIYLAQLSEYPDILAEVVQCYFFPLSQVLKNFSTCLLFRCSALSICSQIEVATNKFRLFAHIATQPRRKRVTYMYAYIARACALMCATSSKSSLPICQISPALFLRRCKGTAFLRNIF